MNGWFFWGHCWSLRRTCLWERRKQKGQWQIYRHSYLMLIVSQIITQLLTSTLSVVSEQQTEKWPLFFGSVLFLLLQAGDWEEGRISCVSLSVQSREPAGFSYLLMAFFKYCCSHLVSGLMQTSRLLFSLALQERQEGWDSTLHFTYRCTFAFIVSTQRRGGR